MKRFNFQLQKVLELRKFREDEARVELGRAISALSEIENRIAENARCRGHAAAERFADAANSAAMLSWDNYMRRLEQESEKLAREAARAELAVEEKRGLYLEASRELKVLEKLKEKREQEYRKEFFAAETAELDDLWRSR
jgi:flagellar FliJ protein